MKIAKGPVGFWVIFGFLVFVGLIAAAARFYVKALYGAFEVIFALFAIYYGLTEATGNSPDNTKVFLSVGAGIYVIVRGIHNMIDGWSDATLIVNAMRRGTLNQP